MHFIVEEIDEDTSMEELQKMMLVALVYRILVCFYEVSRWHMKMLKCFCAVQWQLFLLPDCLHLGGGRRHSGEVSCGTPSRYLRLVRSGSAWQGTCGASNECVPVCVSCWYSIADVFWFSPASPLSVPLISVSSYRSAIRALNKNFSIAFFFPAFITLLFFQHNRTVYDMVAGTIVVKRSRVRWCGGVVFLCIVMTKTTAAEPRQCPKTEDRSSGCREFDTRQYKQLWFLRKRVLFILDTCSIFYKLVYLLLSLFCVRNVKVFLKGKNGGYSTFQKHCPASFSGSV